MIKKLLDNLYNISLHQIERLSTDLWDNIRDAIFPKNTEEKEIKEISKL